MGNYRFKLSDMIPNAWFYKLHKEINRSSNNTVPVAVAAAGSTKKKHHLLKHLSDHTPSPPPTQTQPNNNSPSSYHLARKSYYLPRSTSRPSSATVDSFTETHHHCSPHSDSSSSSSAAASSSILLFESSPELRLDRVLTPDTTTSLCEYGPAANDNSSFLPNNNNKNKNRVDDMLDELEVELPRILTKPAVKLKDHHCIYSLKTSSSSSAHTTKSKTKSKTTSSSRSKKVQLHNYNNIRTAPRKLSLLSPGKKIRIRSPKIVQPRRISTSLQLSNNKTPLSDSFAIVKSSFDPHTDFRESMLEMIVEHNIKGSKDLEDLLACYLSLNADEYHHLIIKVFKQIWFDLTDIIN